MTNLTEAFRTMVITAMLISPWLLAQSQAPCQSEQASQFDFWVGEWELSWPAGQAGTPEGETGSGRNVIRKTLGGCTIEENFSTRDSSYIGRSWSVYQPANDQWQQTWVDNSGGYLLFTGHFKDGQMELRTQPFDRNGKRVISRMVFRDIGADGFFWDWQRSEDDGESWTDVWNIQYQRASSK